MPFPQLASRLLAIIKRPSLPRLGSALQASLALLPTSGTSLPALCIFIVIHLSKANHRSLSIELVFDLHSGQTIFISAAAGGVGIVAIQLAKRRGLRVIASCSTDANAKLLRSLGADHVIQYNRVASDLTEQLSRLAPIHIYWDNVSPFLCFFLLPSSTS